LALAGSSDRFEPQSYATILHDVLRQRQWRACVLCSSLNDDISATVRDRELMAALARPLHTDLAHQIGFPG